MKIIINQSSKGSFVEWLLCGSMKALLVIVLIVVAGCSSPTKKNSTLDVKITDFSELQIPGDGLSASFLIRRYEIPIERFALIRIFAEQAQNLRLDPIIAERLKKDGLYYSLASLSDYDLFEEAMQKSTAQMQRNIAMLLYDSSSEYFWLKKTIKDTLIYDDWQSLPKMLNLSNGRLGFALSISSDDKSPPVLIVAPVFQENEIIPEKYLKYVDKEIDTGRTVMTQLSITAMMQRGDFLLLCPEIMPLDDMTFSKYVFRSEDKSKFNIYCIFCKNITASNND